jgi:hypothetical protein
VIRWRTAAADFCNAAFTFGVSLVSMICWMDGLHHFGEGGGVAGAGASGSGTRRGERPFESAQGFGRRKNAAIRGSPVLLMVWQSTGQLRT